MKNENENILREKYILFHKYETITINCGVQFSFPTRAKIVKAHRRLFCFSIKNTQMIIIFTM